MISQKDITDPIVELSEQTTLLTNKEINFKPINTNVLEISKLSNNFENMIKELKEQANRLNVARIVAEKANKSKDEFLANISHELRTPLNSINVLSEIMKHNKAKNLTEKDIKNLTIINKCGNELLVLISDILDYSKLNAGKLTLNFETIEINTFIENIVNNFESQFKAKNINFEVYIDKNLSYMSSDSARISQIINNLLSNACKFTPEYKSVYLNIIEEKEHINIQVKDEGIGIPKEKQKIIFDRFSQVDGSTARKFGGTGLGLTICSELVDLLNGEIKVKSKENEGSIFEVRIPKNSKNIDIQSKPKVTVEPSSNKEETSDKKQRVLFLNPNPIEYMNKVVELKNRFEVRQVFNYDTFVELIQTGEFDKVLVDDKKMKDEDLEELKNLLKINSLFLAILRDNQ